MIASTAPDQGFTEEQKSYLDGFLSGVRNRGVAFGDVEPSPVADSADESVKSSKLKLAKEEAIKAELDPLDAFPRLREDAKTNAFPSADNVFRFKWNGLFWLAPVHDAYMCRLRIPGGVLKTYQWRELASIADDLASGFGQITTRNNLQLRLIQPKDTPELMRRLVSVGLHSRGSGADNLRNFTANPTAGICPHELIDVLPFINDLATTVMQSTYYYDLPRKFNISFDGGNTVGVAEDTNDIGFRAVRAKREIPQGHPLHGMIEPGGIYFRVLLGGVSGHQEWAEDSGILCRPGEAVDLALALVRVYIENGNRGNRKKARMIYLLKAWGYQRYVDETEVCLGHKLMRVSETDAGTILESPVRPTDVPHPHLGAFPQKQDGLNYLGVHVPVGIIETDRMRALAEVADTFGSGELRLTIFQSLIIPNIPDDKLEAAKAAVVEGGLNYRASLIRGGLAACTGNRYCKYSSADTKCHAVALADYLEERIELDQPLNIHVTGCAHSCAQHYIGDIGLLACKVERGGKSVEGFHVFVGGGFRDQKRFGRQLFKGVATGEELQQKVLALLRTYLDERQGGERFQDFTVRHDIDELAKAVEAKLQDKAA
ncbi:NirA family protein [soil metagenome]